MRIGFAIALLVAAPLKPPVVHEVFTPLPCPKHQVSTLDIEGCYEQAILKTDKQINLQAAMIFKLLTPSARPGFVHSEKTWLAYRNESCQAESSKYAGGTGAGIEDAACVATLDHEHLHDLVQFRMFLQVH